MVCALFRMARQFASALWDSLGVAVNIVSQKVFQKYSNLLEFIFYQILQFALQILVKITEYAFKQLQQ